MSRSASTEKMKHAEGLLRVFGDICIETVETGSTIAECRLGDPFHPVTEDERAANARRLTACWNACVDVPTEDLEKSPNVTEYIADQVDEIKEQRDQLLEVAQDYHRSLWQDLHSSISVEEFDRHPTVVKVRATIAACGGE